MLRVAARKLRAVERSSERLQARVPSAGGRRGRGARLSAEDIRGLRARLGARVLDVRKMGVRKARARVGPAGRPGRLPRRRVARQVTRRHARSPSKTAA